MTLNFPWSLHEQETYLSGPSFWNPDEVNPDWFVEPFETTYLQTKGDFRHESLAIGFPITTLFSAKFKLHA